MALGLYADEAYLFVFQKEKIMRQQGYARQIMEKNRQTLENSRYRAPPPRPKPDPEKEHLSDRRKLVRREVANL